MSQPPMDDDFQNRIQRILNEKKKEDLRKQHGMSFEGHSEEMSPQAEGNGWITLLNSKDNLKMPGRSLSASGLGIRR